MDRPRSETSTSLIAFLSSHPFFAGFDASGLADVEAELELTRVDAGIPLFRQGDPADGMYILLRGLLRIMINQPDGTTTMLDMLDPGTSVGEMALLTGQPRSATVEAVNEAELVKLSKAGFDRLSKLHPEEMEAFAHTIVPRWRRTQLAGALTKLYGPLEGDAVHELQNRLEWIHLAGGETLFNQGDPGDSMYIVVNGRLQIVVRQADGHEQFIAEVGRGESVGEFALLTGEPRSATVYASRDSDVVKLTQSEFEQLIDRHPRAMLQMNRGIVQRTQQSLRHQAQRSTTIATIVLIPIRPSQAFTQLADRFAHSLEALGSTLYLSSDRIDRMHEREGAAQTESSDPTDIAIAGWLTEQEAAHRYIVYRTDDTLTPWTRRCLRQADRIVLVAEAGDSTALSEIEQAMQQMRAGVRADLVLIQPDGIAMPSGTRAWLKGRPIRAHHHTRLGNDGDIRRLARRISGRGTGLVLSGGGARGFAHIGVLRALDEAGIDIDVVGGTSIGSLMGAGYVMGWEYERITELAQSFASPKKIMDRTLPFTSLMASAKVTNLFRELFGEVQIEDLWRSYFCVSSDLTRAEPVVHHEGLLWEAVRASTAIPGIFAPFLYDGRVLVDGAVMNHFPIDLVREACEAGHVIAINTSPRTEKLRNYRFGPSVSGWQVLRSKINPFGGSMRAPSILHTLMRATEINSVYNLPAIEGLADTIIQPPVEGYKTLDFGSYREIIDIGYEAAQPFIGVLKEQQQFS